MTGHYDTILEERAFNKDVADKKAAYTSALAKVKAENPANNYLCIEIDNGLKIVLPYIDGMTLMTALNNAEQLDERYGDPGRINPLERRSICSFILSGVDYQYYKMAALLNMTFEELRSSMKANK